MLTAVSSCQFLQGNVRGGVSVAPAAAAIQAYMHVYGTYLEKVQTFLWLCKLQEYHLLYFISIYHSDLLNEKLQPLIKTECQVSF